MAVGVNYVRIGFFSIAYGEESFLTLEILVNR
jgi:hypothetical protein